MKKVLLLLAAVGFASFGVWADSTKVVFDEDKDMYGWTLQTGSKYTDLTFEKNWSFEQDGIQFDFEDTSTVDGNHGFALTYANANDAGLAVSANMMNAAGKAIPHISISIPGGKITGVTMIMNGTSIYSINVKFTPEGGSAVTKEAVEVTGGTNRYSWTWTEDAGGEGVESVDLDFALTYYMIYIDSIEVTYTPDLGGKEACGLSFSAPAATGVQGEAFTAPEFNNPNNLPVSWASSDEAVAKVNDEGEVELLAGGKTTITASTVGNDDYAGGKAQYDLTVIPAATSIAKMISECPNAGGQVKVNFPMTVMYATQSNAYVQDAEGNATYIHNTKNDGSTGTGASATLYKVGDVIPAGWVATNASDHGDWIWNGEPADPTETVEVTYAEVDNITQADADKVLTLKNVTFTDKTPFNDAYVNASTSDGTVEVRNSWALPQIPAGTYDIVGIVKYSQYNGRTFFYIAPIEYIADPIFPEEFDVTADVNTVTIEQAYDEDYECVMISVTGTSKNDNVTLTFDLPSGWENVNGVSCAGWDGVLCQLAEMPGGMKYLPSDNWPTLGSMEGESGSENVQKGKTITIPADGKIYMAQCMLYTGDKVDEENRFAMMVTVVKEDEVEVPAFPAGEIEMECDETSVTISQMEDDEKENNTLVTVSGTSKTETFKVTVNVPEGYDGMIGGEMEGMVGASLKMATGDDDEDPDMVYGWVPVDEFKNTYGTIMKGDLQQGKDLTFPADDKAHMYMFWPYSDENGVATVHSMMFSVNVKKNILVGVVSVEVESGNARYFNLQGVEVANPENGIYLKELNGKITKEIVK